jgi:hypothetical protein
MGHQLCRLYACRNACGKHPSGRKIRKIHQIHHGGRIFDVANVFDSDAGAIQADSQRVYGGLMTNTYTSSIEESITKEIVKNYPKFEGAVTIRIDEDLESDTYGAVTRVDIDSNIKLNNSTIEKIINDFYSEGEVNININVLTEVK